jgi:uncharacterized RDD family membrane protein YckC
MKTAGFTWKQLQIRIPAFARLNSASDLADSFSFILMTDCEKSNMSEAAPADAGELSTRIEELDSALRAGNLEPENVRERFRVVRPVEKLLSTVPVEPPSGDKVQDVLQLLWMKSHPQAARPAVLVEKLASLTPLVRLCAAEAMAAWIESGTKSDSLFLLTAKQSVQNLCRKEESAAVAMVLTELVKRIGKAIAETGTFAVPAPLTNPYIAGQPIRDRSRFFGREDVLARIGKAFRNGAKTVLIFGARRSGKTSLLLRMADGGLGSDFLAAHIDLLGSAGADFGRLVKTLADLVRKLLENRARRSPAGPVADDFETLRRTIDNAIKAVDGKNLVILFDEYERLEECLSNAEDSKRLQGLVESEPKLFFVFAGAEKIDSFSNRDFLILFDNAKPFNISFLKPEEAKALITQPVLGAIEYEPDAVETILEFSGGHPFYTQLLCQGIFDLCEGRGKVTASGVDKAIAAFMENPSPHLVYLWNTLTADQRLVAAVMAQLTSGGNWAPARRIVDYLKEEGYPAPLDLQKVQGSLRGLRETDLVRKQEQEPSYRFTMDVLRRWVAENRSVWELKRERIDQVRSTIAGPGRRIFSKLLDWALVTAGWGSIMLLFAPNLVRTLAIVAAIYYVVAPLMAEKTLGMRVFGLHVLHDQGRRPSLWQVAVFGALLGLEYYLFFYTIYYFPRINYSIVFLAFVFEILHLVRIAVSKSRVGLFDAIARLIVVREKENAS